MTEATGPAAEISSLDDFLECVELRHVFFDSFSAQLIRFGEPHSGDMVVSIDYAREPDTILFRYTVKGKLVAASGGATQDKEGVTATQAQASTSGDTNDDVLAEFGVVLVCNFSLSDHLSPPEPVLDEFGAKVGYRVAFPYLREAFTSACSRLGFSALTFSMLRDGEEMPRNLTGRRHLPA